MEPGVVLLGFCVAMFAGAFLAGYIPLSFGLSEEKLRLITIFGAGLLVGTALIVIIPEGIGMHFSAQMKMLDKFHDHDASQHRLLHQDLGDSLPDIASESASKHDHFDAQWQIGLALSAGFCFQLIIDRISGGIHGHSHGVVVGSEAGATDAVNAEIAAMSAKSRSAMAGMIVHAAVDGVALGAAMKEGNSAVGFIVFIAIMLHKAPSAFGLTSYLLHHGLSRESVLKRLVFFCFAAPVGTILTYLFLSLNLFVYHETLVAQFLLFSGGTFLYVATAHILPEVQTNSHITSKEKDEDEEGATAPHVHYHAHAPLMLWSETGILVLGILLPLLINFGHGH